MGRILHHVIISLIAISVFAQWPHASTQAVPVTAVKELDIKRYMGHWYEIAKYPNPFQKQCIGAKAFYQLVDHQTLKVQNSCLRANGAITQAHGYAYLVSAREARLKVQFFLTFWRLTWLQGDYWVIKIGKDYDYAIVSDPRRKYLWVLSRTPQMNEVLYQDILHWLKSQGFELEKIRQNKAYKF